jgi:hypothetical protein
MDGPHRVADKFKELYAIEAHRADEHSGIAAGPRLGAALRGPHCGLGRSARYGARCAASPKGTKRSEATLVDRTTV